MGVASLVLGILSLVFGIVPLLPLGPFSGTLALYLPALGLPFGAVGMCLGLIGRSEAIVLQRRVGLYTTALSLAVVGTIVCSGLIGSLFYAQRKFIRAAEACRHDPRACPKPISPP